ncbi:hypothetical protein EYF80_066285 [Liparis tanakae]|uniref:Uncharacterized protein n=1 Tax=Liparis tanakae TaxID=230148 RepID=A0A4Z2E4Q4_9TELE|nr:hypothetical protein EYF80_066285 [Liparis tanakae]
MLAVGVGLSASVSSCRRTAAPRCPSELGDTPNRVSHVSLTRSWRRSSPVDAHEAPGAVSSSATQRCSLWTCGGGNGQAGPSCAATRSLAHLSASDRARATSPEMRATLAAALSEGTSFFLAMTFAASKLAPAAR